MSVITATFVELKNHPLGGYYAVKKHGWETTNNFTWTTKTEKDGRRIVLGYGDSSEEEEELFRSSTIVLKGGPKDGLELKYHIDMPNRI